MVQKTIGLLTRKNSLESAPPHGGVAGPGDSPMCKHPSHTYTWEGFNSWRAGPARVSRVSRSALLGYDCFAIVSVLPLFETQVLSRQGLSGMGSGGRFGNLIGKLSL